jgi:hypothetical protein
MATHVEAPSRQPWLLQAALGTALSVLLVTGAWLAVELRRRFCRKHSTNPVQDSATLSQTHDKAWQAAGLKLGRQTDESLRLVQVTKP